VTVSSDKGTRRGETLRLRNLDMIAHIRRAEDKEAVELLERQQAMIRLGRMFAGEPTQYADLVDYANRLKRGERS
jgi:hypothetical protein